MRWWRGWKGTGKRDADLERELLSDLELEEEEQRERGLYGTAPYDPAVIAAVILTLLSIASIACIFPAWRASRLHPMQALRTE